MKPHARSEVDTNRRMRETACNSNFVLKNDRTGPTKAKASLLEFVYNSSQLYCDVSRFRVTDLGPKLQRGGPNSAVDVLVARGTRSSRRARLRVTCSLVREGRVGKYTNVAIKLFEHAKEGL